MQEIGNDVNSKEIKENIGNHFARSQNSESGHTHVYNICKKIIHIPPQLNHG